MFQLSVKSTCKTIYPNYTNCDWTSNEPSVHPLRVADTPVLDKDNTVTCSIDDKFYDSITLEELFNLIPVDEEEKNGYIVKDVRNRDKITVTILDSTHSVFSPHIKKFKGLNDEDLLLKGMARVNFVTKNGDKISVTTDTFTHNYSTLDGKNHVYASEYLTGEPYDPDTEMATMGAVDGDEVITYKLSNRLYVESFARAWNRVNNYYNAMTVFSKNTLYVNTPGLMIYDSSSNGFVEVKRMIRNNDMGRWNRITTHSSSLLLTSDHPLPTQRGRIETAMLDEQDHIMMARHQYSEISSNNISSDLAWLLGVIICDGCYSNGGIVCCFGMDEYDIATKVMTVIRKEFGIEARIKEQHRGEKGDYFEVSAYDVNISNYLASFFEGINKIDRHIPSCVFADFSIDAKFSFLAGMIDADGYIRRTNLNNDGTARGDLIYIGSTNHELAVQQMLLARALGLNSRLSINYYKGINYPNNIRYSVSISMCKAFENTIVCNKKNKFNKNFIAYRISDEMESIKSVEFIGDRNRYEYDVETVSDRFDVSGFNSHNCRTLIGYDRHGMGYKKTGRGNVAPVTMVLPKLGIQYGICLGERKEADVEGFFKAFDDLLNIAEKSLVDRFNYVCSQNPRAGWFMYENSSIADGDKVLKSGKIYDAMRHGTLALGYLGIANTCYAMFGKYHHEDPEVMKFADRIIATIKKRADEASERHNLNFSAYSSPVENACYTICKNLQKEYGKIKGVTDEEFITNSLHVPVFAKVGIKEKLDVETQLAKYTTGGEINYVELESSVAHNYKAVEQIIHYGMKINIPYLAINHPIDTCQDCGSRVEEFAKVCHKCGSTNIQSLRRVTGYLTTDYRKFSVGKVQEVLRRTKHSKMTNFADLTK